MRKKRIPTLILAAILFLALAATAFAVSNLRQSEEVTAALAARQLVMDTYGFSSEGLALFVQEISKDGETYRITYLPIKYPGRFGEYAVTLRPGQEPTVFWTHDQRDPSLWASGELSDSIWGAVHGDKYLAVDIAFRTRVGEIIAANEAAGLPPWSTENQAEVDKILMEAHLPHGLDGQTFVVMPSEEDLEESKAIALARDAVARKYGFTEDQLARYTPHTRFFGDSDGQKGTYEVIFSTEDNLWDPQIGFLSVNVTSPAGQIAACTWSIEKTYRTLPEGPLGRYQEAVMEYINQGCMRLLSHEDRAALSDRILAAGFSLGLQYLPPSKSATDEEKAIAVANEAFAQEFGLQPEMLTLFERETAYIYLSGVATWTVTYAPQEAILWPLSEPLGQYYANIADSTGQLLYAEWTLSHIAHDTSGYAESTWGQSPIYDSRLLPYVLAFEGERAQVMAKLEAETDPNEGWSHENAALHDGLYRSAGFDASSYPRTMPGDGDLSEEQALQIALEAMADAYGITPDDISRTNAACLAADPDRPVWSFFFIFSPNGDCYVEVDIKTGEVRRLQYLTTGNG